MAAVSFVATDSTVTTNNKGAVFVLGIKVGGSRIWQRQKRLRMAKPTEAYKDQNGVRALHEAGEVLLC